MNGAAPATHAAGASDLGQWSEKDLADFLQSGISMRGAALGRWRKW